MISEQCTSRHQVLLVAPLPTIVKEINLFQLLWLWLAEIFLSWTEIVQHVSSITYSNVISQCALVTIFHNNAQIIRIEAFEWFIIFDDKFMLRTFKELNLIPSTCIWIFDDFHGCNLPFSWRECPYLLSTLHQRLHFPIFEFLDIQIFGSFQVNMSYFKWQLAQLNSLRQVRVAPPELSCCWWVWQYRLWSFQGRDTKLERFLHKN